MMHFLRLSSLGLLVFIIASCTQHPYKYLQVDSRANRPSALAYTPKFDRELYRCVVDGKIVFKKFHLSGILILKHLEDSTTRVVFQNEMGISFFDFSWDKQDSFHVISILDQLNKPGLVKTLKKDFELVLMKNLSAKSEIVYTMDDAGNPHYIGPFFYHFPLEKGYAFYYQPLATGPFTEIDNYGKQKVISISETLTKPRQLADTIFIRHHKAHFTIDLKKIKDNE